MKHLPPELIELSARQHGLLTIDQLAQAGFRSREIALRVQRRDWARISSRVIALHAFSLDRVGRLWAAALHFDGCVLGGPSALELRGLPAPHDGRIHLIGPRGGRPAPFAGCVIHTELEPTVDAARGPSVSAALAVAQCLRWAVTDLQGVFHATWALQRRLITLEQLQAAVKAMPRSPGTANARRRLAFIVPGEHAVSEHQFSTECRRHGLPEPVRQTHRKDSRGRSRFTDVEFRLGDRVIVVEIDGLAHLNADVMLDDAFRSNDLVLANARVLRLPALALRVNSDAFFSQIRRALSQVAAA